MKSVDERYANAARCEFRVVAGVHRGATFALRGEDFLVIGADVSCDICLSDAGLAPRHAAVTLQGAHVSIRRLDGPVSVNGQLLSPSVRIPLASAAEVKLLDTGIQLQLGAATLSHSNIDHSDRPAPRPATRMPRALVVMVLVLVVVVLAGFTAQNLSASRQSSSGAGDLAAVRTVLQQHHLDEQVKVSTTSSGALISGVLTTESAAQLREALATLSVPIVNSIVTDDELLGQVRDVFRTHGYDAQVTYLGNAQVRVDNLDENHERVRTVAAQVRADASQLASLSFASIRDTAPPDQPPVYESGSGDRLSATINGETGYLAAANDARYFVGSVLPDGHTVRRITQDAVQVDRDGQISWFRF